METERILKLIVKHSLIFTFSAIIGLVFTVIILMPFLLGRIAASAGLTIIVLAPLLFLLYSFLGFIGGGILGIIIYYIWKLVKSF